MLVRYKADFIGKIARNFFWEAGYHFHYMKINEFSSKKYDLDNTLYGMYTQWGIIPEDEKNGGFSSAVRVGLMYDSRDIEASPSRGIWAEANFAAAPGFLGTSHPYNKLTATFRHYVPVVSDKLVFAYRIAYQGFFGNAPWYMLPFYNVVGPAYDRDGLGGYRTVRGPILNRIQGLQSGFYNAEFRWRFIDFKLWKQNIGLALNGFCDGAMVFKGMDLTNRTGALPEYYSQYVKTGTNDKLHVAAGAGFRFIMNRNFIVALEFAQCTNRQDGGSSFYINTGYLF